MNRYLWKIVTGFVLIAGILLGLARLSLWIPALLVAAVLLPMMRDWGVRLIQIRNRGYFGGRRRKDKWIYEERSDGVIRSLILDVENTEPGHYEIFIRDDSEWRAIVPAWASERRVEIADRIAERWKEGDFHMSGSRTSP